MEKHSSNLIAKSFKGLFKRFHLLIFFVFIVGCLSAVVILVSQILGSEVDQPVGSPATPNAIDQATLQQVRTLHQSSSAPAPELPVGEINPFEP